MPSRLRSCLTFVALLGALAACTGLYNNWTPLVDADNDPNADRLAYDTAQCRHLALRAGIQETTVEPNAYGNVFSLPGAGDYWTDDFDSVQIKAYRHAFIACLKERQHPVLTLMPAP